MRIIGIPGIWDFPRLYSYMWKHLKRAFGKKISHDSFDVEHLFYSPWEWQKMRNFADHLVEKYDTGEELLIVGYSLGGVIAAAMVPRFKRSKVRCVVTIFAPHRYLFGLFSWILNSNPSEIGTTAVLSFGARLDLMVPCGSVSRRSEAHGAMV